MGEATLTVHQAWLGVDPYTLIELRPASDGSGEPALFVEAGGGAEDQPLYMPLLVISEAPAEDNPVAEMLREVYRTAPGVRAGVEVVTRNFNEDWLPFVRGDQ